MGEAARSCLIGANTQRDEDTSFLSVNEELQSELALLPPAQRVDVCFSLLGGKLPPEFAGGEDELNDEVHLLFKDAQDLRAVLGLALLKLGRFTEAHEIWVQS